MINSTSLVESVVKLFVKGSADLPDLHTREISAAIGIKSLTNRQHAAVWGGGQNPPQRGAMFASKDQQPLDGIAGFTVVVPDDCSAGLGAEVSFWRPANAKTETTAKIEAIEIIFFVVVHLLSFYSVISAHSLFMFFRLALCLVLAKYSRQIHITSSRMRG
jgi:hypothetical protein